MSTKEERLAGIRKEASKYFYQNRNGLPQDPIPFYLINNDGSYISFNSLMNIDFTIDTLSPKEEDQVYLLICIMNDRTRVVLTRTRHQIIDTYESWLYFCRYK